MSFPDLSGNFLTELKAGLFANLSSLSELNLSRNQLTGLKKRKQQQPVLWELPSLERLNLAHNQMTEVPDRSFRSLGSLRVLDLSNNQLQSLGDEALVGLKVIIIIICIIIIIIFIFIFIY